MKNYYILFEFPSKYKGEPGGSIPFCFQLSEIVCISYRSTKKKLREFPSKYKSKILSLKSSEVPKELCPGHKESDQSTIELLALRKKVHTKTMIIVSCFEIALDLKYSVSTVPACISLAQNRKTVRLIGRIVHACAVTYISKFFLAYEERSSCRK